MTRPLNLKQLKFVKLYIGGDATLMGNATACYREAYRPNSSLRVLQAMASKLLRQPKVQAMIARATVRAVEAVDWSAQTVLEQSIRLYDRCMGDIDYPVTLQYLDKETGEPKTSTIRRSDYNPSGARGALELIGRNTGIQAFQENIEVSHTHYLEQALARRAKVIEGRAVPVLPGPGDQPGHAPGNSDPARRYTGRPDPVQSTPAGSEKEGPSSGGQAKCANP